MHPQVSILVKLQNLDLSIGKIQKTKENYPQKIELLKNRLEKERKITESEKEKLEKLEKDRRREERTLEEEIERITRSEEKLFSVKTNKEYQAVLKEIALAKESNSEREEKILNILEELDVLRKELWEKEKNFEEISRKFKKESSELEEKLKAFDNQLAEKIKSREKLFSKIDPEIIQMYENLRGGRQGIAVVATKNGFCQGCNMGMPPQLSNEVQKGGDLVFCPNCNRILYWVNNS